MASTNVEDEWQYYFDEGKPVIPLWWQPAPKIHFQLRRIQYVNFYEQEFTAAFAQLCAELARHGYAVSESNGQMHAIDLDEVTLSPTPPRIQGGRKHCRRLRGFSLRRSSGAKSRRAR